jgi:hypothetical protein
MVYRDTSALAWRSFLPVSPILDDMILAALRASSGGLTCQEIEGVIEREHQAVSGNLRHLVEKGRAFASGRKGTTRSGRAAIIWTLSPPASPTISHSVDDDRLVEA